MNCSATYGTMTLNHFRGDPTVGSCNAWTLWERRLADVHLFAQSEVWDQSSDVILLIGEWNQNVLGFDVSVNDVQMVEVTQPTRGLIQNFFDADQLFQVIGVLPFDVILKGRRAKLHCDVSKLAVTLCAEIPDDVLVSVRLSQQTDFSIRQREAVRQQSLHCHFTLLKRPSEHKSSFTSFAENVPWIKGNLADLNELT